MYTNRATASDGLLFDILDDVAASARGAMDAMAAVAPRSGRNSRRVRRVVCDFRSCLEFSDEAMMPPCKTIVWYFAETCFRSCGGRTNANRSRSRARVSWFAVARFDEPLRSEKNLGPTGTPCQLAFVDKMRFHV